MAEILETIDWSPLFISLKTGILATVLAFFAGIAAARFIMKLNNTAKAVVDGLLTLPLVLPPTVAGFFLLLIFSLRRPFGKYLYTQFDIKMVQTWPGCVIAALVIAFPLMYRNARAAFEQIDVNVIYAGRTLGMSERKIFWKVVVPMQLRDLHPVRYLRLQERLESMVQLPCLPEIFLEKPERYPWQLLRRSPQETGIPQHSGSV